MHQHTGATGAGPGKKDAGGSEKSQAAEDPDKARQNAGINARRLRAIAVTWFGLSLEESGILTLSEFWDLDRTFQELRTEDQRAQAVRLRWQTYQLLRPNFKDDPGSPEAAFPFAWEQSDDEANERVKAQSRIDHLRAMRDRGVTLAPHLLQELEAWPDLSAD